MSPSDNEPDAVIVGAGIAGSALAVSLARSGYSVTLLEKSTVHVDRVRGVAHNDPSGGQGISIALKDARLVSEALEANKAWTPETFAPYASQRREQMRRIRFSTRLLAVYRMEFTDEGRRRRRDGRQRMVADPELMLPFAAMQKGPFAVPSEVFSKTTWDRLLGDA